MSLQVLEPEVLPYKGTDILICEKTVDEDVAAVFRFGVEASGPECCDLVAARFQIFAQEFLLLLGQLNEDRVVFQIIELVFFLIH